MRLLEMNAMLAVLLCAFLGSIRAEGGDDSEGTCMLGEVLLSYRGSGWVPEASAGDTSPGTTSDTESKGSAESSPAKNLKVMFLLKAASKEEPVSVSSDKVFKDFCNALDERHPTMSAILIKRGANPEKDTLPSHILSGLEEGLREALGSVKDKNASELSFEVVLTGSELQELEKAVNNDKDVKCSFKLANVAVPKYNQDNSPSPQLQPKDLQTEAYKLSDILSGKKVSGTGFFAKGGFLANHAWWIIAICGMVLLGVGAFVMFGKR